MTRFRFAPGRRPAVAGEAMVATSQPLATRCGLRALERGGNAADAALAAAAMLCVTEPMSTGIGGDAFAIVWRDRVLEGIDAAGPAPQAAAHGVPVSERGPRSVTVPGAVAGWVGLAERHGRLGLERCLADAIDVAERGYAVAARTAAAWSAVGTGASWTRAVIPPELSPPPVCGQRVRLPELASTLRAVAAGGASAFYEGPVAAAICSVSWLDEADLAGYRARIVEPLRIDYHDHEVVELPPPTQGVAALEALGLLAGLEPDLRSQIDCVRLALDDARARVRDGAEVADLLSEPFLARRRDELPPVASELPGGTVYLCAVDADRMAVSFIQSLYGSFGSGLIAPATGVVLQNRGACFAMEGGVSPGKRPYHTIIPGMLLRDGALAGPFGVMGGFIQAQAHLQLVSALVDERLDPQAALDQPRFWVDGPLVRLEEGLWDRAEELRQHGYEPVCDDDPFGFGGGQAILVESDSLLGGSDARKDGYAAGY